MRDGPERQDLGHGWRSYSVGIGSYLQRCGGYVYARHLIYIDTRNLPDGHKLWITVFNPA